MEDAKTIGNIMAKNASMQLMGRVLYLMTRVVMPPLTLHFVGLDEYGIWAASFILVSYLGMSTFGVSSVYTRYVADYRARGDMDGIGALISTGLTLTLTLTAVLLTAVWFAMPWLLLLFGVPNDLHEVARLVFFGTAAIMMADLSVGAFAYVLHGLHLMWQNTLVWIASFLLETVLAIILLFQGFGILSLLIAFGVRYAFAIVIQAVLCLRALPEVQIRIGRISGKHLRLLLGFGGVMQLVGLVSTVLYSIEKVLAGRVLGVASVGVLDLAQKFPVLASQTFSSITVASLPALSHLYAGGKRQEAAALYVRAARWNSLLVALPLGFLASFAEPIMRAWLGSEQGLGDTPLLLLIAAVGYQIHTLTGPASAVHQAVERPTRQFLYVGLQTVLCAVGLIWVWQVWGWSLIAIALAVGAARVISSLVYGIYTERLIGVSIANYPLRVVLPGALPYLVGWLGYQLTGGWLTGLYADRWLLLPALGLVGLVYCLAVALVYLPLLDAKDRRAVAERLPKRVRMSLARRGA
jgi:O-antigen/teichoic acid export membrane protein